MALEEVLGELITGVLIEEQLRIVEPSLNSATICSGSSPRSRYWVRTRSLGGFEHRQVCQPIRPGVISFIQGQRFGMLQLARDASIEKQGDYLPGASPTPISPSGKLRGLPSQNIKKAFLRRVRP